MDLQCLDYLKSVFLEIQNMSLCGVLQIGSHIRGSYSKLYKRN